MTPDQYRPTMDLLLRSATIIDPASIHNGATRDIRIKDGTISEIGENLKAEDKTESIEAEGLHVSPGWFDMHVNFRDPGYEHKEDLVSGAAAAAQGGFTGVAVMPSTNPVTDSKGGVDYLVNRSRSLPVNLHPVGALSNRLEGNDIAGMFDMFQAGAVAFSDDRHPVMDTGLMTNALLYVTNFNGLVISYPDDKTISRDGKMNEGAISTQLGLKGIPELAEELHITRDLYLLEYTGSRLHFSPVSTPRSVDLIRKAKEQGLNITCEVTAHHLLLDEEYLSEYDSNYKVMPPLRSKTTIEALREGLKDGTIDHITSDHAPEDPETKRVEFDRAAFGIIGLESAFGAARTATKKFLSLEELIDRLAIRPRRTLGLDVPAVQEGAEAELTLFAPDQEWEFGEDHIRSRSRNTPFLGTRFTGKPLGIINKGEWTKAY